MKKVLLSPALQAPRVVRAQEDGKLGIENSKIVLTVVVTFFVDLIAAVREKRYIAIIEILFGLIKYGNIIAIANLAWAEFNDYDSDEIDELNAHFARVFDLENDQVEELVERAVAVVPDIYDIAQDSIGIYGRVRAIFDATKELENVAA